MQACEPLSRRAGAKILPLHGDLTPEEQDAAVAPSATRKIICSTNVAESSITIDGVRAVIDSGLARVMSYSPWSGLSHLRIERISKASAIQRSGRAGRTSPGIAIRLYSEADFVRRPEQIPPEIARADLSHVILLLAANGLRWEDLRWIDEPSLEVRARAYELLKRLGAIDNAGHITSGGKEMAQLPLHPRLARFVLEAAAAGLRDEACEIAARLSEDRIRIDEETRGRFSSDLDAILSGNSSYAARRLKEKLLKTIPTGLYRSDPHTIEKAFLAAYPDRVARKRGDVLLLSNGSSAKLDRSSHVHSEFLVALEVDDRSDLSVPLVRIASAVQPDWLLDLFPDHISTREEVAWNREAERVEQVNSLVYDQLVIDESRSAPVDSARAGELVAENALEAGLERFADGNELGRFLRRVRFAAQHSAVEIPDDLLAQAVRELANGLTSFAQLREAARDGGLLAILQARLPMREIDEVAPAFVKLPSGRRTRIEYHETRPPSVASRMQDFFGMTETPAVARGTVPLVVQLLAPNHRPVQVTTDLVSFWKNLYPQVRRELSRRYPKHAWPDVPV
jgi:ATP-dependent helicase HrpB